MKYASKGLKVCYILTFFVMLIHIVIGALPFGLLGALSLANVMYYLPVFIILEIFRLGNRFVRTGSIALKISSIVLMAAHVLLFAGFLAVNADQLHTLFTFNGLYQFASLFSKAAFYPIGIIGAYCLDALVGIFAKITKKRNFPKNNP